MARSELVIKDRYLAALEEFVSPVLHPVGLIRSARSYKYVKKNNDLRIVLDTKPVFGRMSGSLARLEPLFEIQAPTVAAVALEIDGNELRWGNANSPIFKCSLTNLVGGADRRAGTIIRDVGDINAVVEGLGRFCEQHVAPLVPRISTTAELLGLRFEYPSFFRNSIGLASIALVHGDPEHAVRLLDESNLEDEDRVMYLEHVYKNIADWQRAD